MISVRRKDIPGNCRNDPKISDRLAWVNTVGPVKTAPRLEFILFSIPSASFGLITLWKSHIVQSLG